MKKSLIALAVAGVVSAPAFAATSNVDVYGVVRFSVDSVSSDVAANEKWSISDRVSRIGFKGSEDLGGGLKALWQIEQGVAVAGAPLDQGTSAFAGGARNTFIGLNGSFGTVLVGRHDTPYKLGGSADLFGDTAADAQGTAGIIGFGNFDLRIAGTVAYVSPTVSGFHVAAAIVPGESVPAADGLMDAYSLVAVYENGPLKATLGYENHDNAVDESAVKLNVGYTMGDIKLGATYEDQSLAANVDSDAFLISAAYAMGPVTLMAQYGERDHETAANDLKRFTLGVGYALSKRSNVYAAYNDDDANGTDSSVVTLGINHSF
jgi:predicted porin